MLPSICVNRAYQHRLNFSANVNIRWFTQGLSTLSEIKHAMSTPTPAVECWDDDDLPHFPTPKVAKPLEWDHKEKQQLNVGNVGNKLRGGETRRRKLACSEKNLSQGLCGQQPALGESAKRKHKNHQ